MIELVIMLIAFLAFWQGVNNVIREERELASLPYAVRQARMARIR